MSLAAADRLRGVATLTPLLESEALNALVGGRLLIKPEPLQRTGSFKFRGAYNAISVLRPPPSSPTRPATTPRAWRWPRGCWASRPPS